MGREAKTWIEFRSGTPDGPPIPPRDVIDVIIGAVPGHDRVVITAMRGRPGDLAGEPIPGCHATVYTSEDGQFPLVSMSPVEMPDVFSADRLHDCAEEADHLARTAWRLLMPGSAGDGGAVAGAR